MGGKECVRLEGTNSPCATIPSEEERRDGGARSSVESGGLFIGDNDSESWHGTSSNKTVTTAQNISQTTAMTHPGLV